MNECRMCLIKNPIRLEYKLWQQCLDSEHQYCNRCMYFNTYLNCPICVFDSRITKRSTNLIYRHNFAKAFSSEYWGNRSQEIDSIHAYHFYSYRYREVLQQIVGLIWGSKNRSATFRFQLFHSIKKYNRRDCRRKILILSKLNLPSEMIRYIMTWVV